MSKTDPSHSRIPADAAERWEEVRRVCAGAQAVKSAGFLPILNATDTSDENRERNAAYVDRAVFYNVTGRTRDGLLGLAFRRDPDASTIPEKFKYLLRNADGNGVSIYQQSQSVVGSVLETGRHGLLVDFSDSLGRPQIKAYRAEDIINWRTEIVGGQSRLTLLVLHEIHEESDGYETVCLDQWREYTHDADGVVTAKLWRRIGASPQIIGEPIQLTTSRGALSSIPFVFVGAQNNDESIDEAPLYDLAHLNIAHYRNSADYEDQVWFAGQAQPWISGLTEEWRDHLESKGAYVGSRAAMPLPVNGAFGYAQVQPNTLAREAMDQKEVQMASLGAQLLEQSQAAKTATQDDNEKEATTSVLATVVANVSEAYGAALRFCGEFAGVDVPEDAAYKINQDFVSIKAEPSMIQAIVAGWQSGAYAKTDARAYLRRLNVISSDRTDEQIEADMESEGPALGAVTDPSAATNVGQ